MALHWEGTAVAYAQSYARLCAGAADAVVDSIARHAVPGTRLLDAGTGTGTVAAAAAAGGFDVHGVDPEPTMIELAARTHEGVRFSVGRLPELPFPDGYFAAVAANFVIAHTMDPRAALRELARVTRPGGPVAVTVWPEGVSPMNALWNDVIELSGAIRPSVWRLSPELDFPRSASGLESVFLGTGFDSVTLEELTWTFRIGPRDLWRAAEGGIGTIGATYLAQDDAGRQRMRDMFDSLTATRLVGGELELEASAILGVGLVVGDTGLEPMTSSV